MNLSVQFFLFHKKSNFVNSQNSYVYYLSSSLHKKKNVFNFLYQRLMTQITSEKVFQFTFLLQFSDCSAGTYNKK
jgi:predicted small secreted protein